VLIREINVDKTSLENGFPAHYQNFVQVLVACSTKTAIFVRVFYKPVDKLLLSEIGACSSYFELFHL
jgi:hypothetical protein